jgi:signal transduction histidine kinase
VSDSSSVPPPVPAGQVSLELLGIVAHDLKTPITSIKSYADLVRQGGELTDRQKLYLQRIEMAVESMTSLIDDLLDLVWLEGGMQLKMVPCNLMDVVRSQVAALEGYAQARGITLHLTSGDNLTVIHADPRRLGQVVSNLVSNGIKYNRKGGNVWVHVARLPQTMEITVCDDGIGIPAEDLPHIFDRFFRAQREETSRVEGSGLGLSIAKAIVERHNGVINVESILGQGTTFHVILPLS